MSHKTKEELDSTDNSSVYRKLHKEASANCSRCSWHGGENRGRRPKHHPKPRKNDHRG